MAKEIDIKKEYEYEIKEWIMKLGSMPVRELEHCNRSRSYEMDVIHVFELENKKYAVVVESGCSCYSADKAEIEVFNTLEEAESQYIKWERDHNSNDYDEPCSCGKHVKVKVEDISDETKGFLAILCKEILDEDNIDAIKTNVIDWIYANNLPIDSISKYRTDHGVIYGGHLDK